ncbi:polyhydroxyalkanoate synthesis regulator DNA-binding domain-containing protein [bacterium]|nr:polyhydroxyalkanoate synthesis regulator DNA-binding domain-containing protein [candidate division CSSED10-310 bacterium]
MDRIIKRYQNRKLYDTATSSYITLKDVETMLRNQEQVKVIDQKTGEDISRQVLIQIIMRTEERQKLPLEGLKTWFSQGENAFRKVFQRTVEIGREVAEKVEHDLSRSPLRRHGGTDEDRKRLDWEAVREQLERFADWITALFNERLKKGLLKLPTLNDTERLKGKLELLDAKIAELERRSRRQPDEK